MCILSPVFHSVVVPPEQTPCIFPTVRCIYLFIYFFLHLVANLWAKIQFKTCIGAVTCADLCSPDISQEICAVLTSDQKRTPMSLDWHQPPLWTLLHVKWSFFPPSLSFTLFNTPFFGWGHGKCPHAVMFSTLCAAQLKTYNTYEYLLYKYRRSFKVSR